jgi:hypothetical protein
MSYHHLTEGVLHTDVVTLRAAPGANVLVLTPVVGMHWIGEVHLRSLLRLYRLVSFDSVDVHLLVRAETTVAFV